MIVHKLIYRYEDGKYIGMVYACNWSFYPIIRKCSYRWKDVTCKNCLRLRKNPQFKGWTNKPKLHEKLKREESGKMKSEKECIDGLEHDIVNCPNCGCRFCTSCDLTDEQESKVSGGKG